MFTGTPFFSVIIPLYNKGPYIKDAINSVLSQTYHNFELIVIDNASTDNGLQIVKSFTDSRIRILHLDEPGPGGYAPRNLGIKAAKTEWITFLDADDLWYENHLELAFQKIGKYPEIEFISFGYDYSDVEGGYSITKEKILSPLLSVNEFLKTGANSCHTNSVVIKKSALMECGLFPTDIKYLIGGDLDTWLRLLLIGKNMLICQEITSIYKVEFSGIYMNSKNFIADHPLVETVKTFLIQQKKIEIEMAISLKKLSNICQIRFLWRKKRAGYLKWKDFRKLYCTVLNVRYFPRIIIIALVPKIILQILLNGPKYFWKTLTGRI
ncbi:MAG: glycosyltransferase family 2 protein [Chitinispirillales bacterium]|jgi:glycosyltransferase involved in cell wall biosynthesis|nr:glycosyltransferase family 2 protein [Chitinispirillales bacterium]